MIASFFVFLIRLFSGLRELNITTSKEAKTIFIARHQSHFDTLAIWAALPKSQRHNLRPIAALDYWGKTKLRKWFSTHVLNAILIDRNAKPSRSQHPLTPLLDALESGSNLLIFPEGTRRSDDALGELKGGIYHLLKKSPDAECLPIRLDNLSRILPKGEFLPLPLIARIDTAPTIRLQPNETKSDFLKRCKDAMTPTHT